LVIVILLYFVDLPAWVYLGYWFLLQVGSSALEAGPGGVAFLAHIGGFVSGLLLIKLFQNRQLVDAKLAGIRLEKSQIRRGGWL
jgi:membrane associated rhomboid family serine protease